MTQVVNARRALVLGGVAACLPRGAVASGSAPAEERPRRLRCNITFRNPKAESVSQTVFSMYAPMVLPGRQALGKTAVSMPYQLNSDDGGHRILRLDLTAMPPFASKTVTLAFEVVLASGEPPERLSRPDQWLGAEKFIEANAPEVVGLAASLRRPNAWETATAIYEWTSQNIRYGASWPMTWVPFTRSAL
jgi:hypothetical protein